MDKKEQISKQFENELFGITDMDHVEEKMEINLPVLLEVKEYLEINKQFKDMNLKLISTFSSEQRKLFNEYMGLELEISAYQNCLAYYLGCKTLIDTDKLK